MNNNKATFLEQSKAKVQDKEHKRKISWNIQKYNTAVLKGKEQFDDLAWARKKAKNIKWNSIEKLDIHLETFESEFTKNGGQVLWANNDIEALDYILEICQKHQAKLVVKSKSMVTEEIHLNPFLEKNGIESIETDLGEFIQQLDGEPPYHIVTPAMHKSKEDVAQLFHKKLGTDPSLTPSQLTLVARDQLRSKFIKADVGITGANFWIADIGGVSITENEGNGRLCTSLPKVQITVVGIEKMLPHFKDLNLFLPLLSTFGTGQQITSYNTILRGPKSTNEDDGPEEMYVIFLDNGRTNLISNLQVRESMYCIRCGACLNACPVYKNIGGHTYNTTYSGPIGSVITPHLKGMEEYVHLSHASSLCGNCTEVCPVNINIHGMLHVNRVQAVQLGIKDTNEAIIWKIWQKAMLHRSWIDIAGYKAKNKVISVVFKNSWAKHRSNLDFAPKNFRQLLKEYKK